MSVYKEIVPKENIKVTSAKIAVLRNAVDLTKSKAYKFGEKDLITLHNNFDMAIGNTQAIMGFTRYRHGLPIPMTVMDRSIFEFCSIVSSIYLICTKTRYDKKYSNVFYEVSKDILKKVMFPENVMSKLNTEVLLEENLSL